MARTSRGTVAFELLGQVFPGVGLEIEPPKISVVSRVSKVSGFEDEEYFEMHKYR